MIINNIILRKYPILETLSEEVKGSLEKDEVSLKTALALTGLSKTESGYLLEVMKKYCFGVNKQQELIRLVSDIAARDNITIKDLLPVIEKEIADKNLKGSNRGTFLISRLREKRYPEVSTFKKELEDKKNIFKREGFNFVLPANLEEEGYKMEISFRDNNELLEKIKKLETIIKKIEN